MKLYFLKCLTIESTTRLYSKSNFKYYDIINKFVFCITFRCPIWIYRLYILHFTINCIEDLPKEKLQNKVCFSPKESLWRHPNQCIKKSIMRINFKFCTIYTTQRLWKFKLMLYKSHNASVWNSLSIYKIIIYKKK